MAHYLIQASYTSTGLSSLVKSPQNRAEAVRPIIEGMGGKLEAFYYAFGDYDVVFIAEMPDNASMAAFSMAASATGAVTFKTTPLISMQEAMEALKKAGGTGYRPPAS